MPPSASAAQHRLQSLPATIIPCAAEPAHPAAWRTVAIAALAAAGVAGAAAADAGAGGGAAAGRTSRAGPGDGGRSQRCGDNWLSSCAQQLFTSLLRLPSDSNRCNGDHTQRLPLSYCSVYVRRLIRRGSEGMRQAAVSH